MKREGERERELCAVLVDTDRSSG